MNILTTVTFEFPAVGNILDSVVAPIVSCVQKEENGYTLFQSNPSFFPRVQFRENADIQYTRVIFSTADSSIAIDLVNKTNQEKKSRHTYKPIHFDRLKRFVFSSIDHVGFNLPWFVGIHPEIQTLREYCKDKSLYHLFPTGENWDFIIPATKEEITGKASIEYSLLRRPKVEIVTFEKTSKPLIQIDVNISKKTTLDELKKLFPEGLVDENINNIWIYMKNPLGIDICYVLNPGDDPDWSPFFKDSRFI